MSSITIANLPCAKVNAEKSAVEKNDRISDRTLKECRHYLIHPAGFTGTPLRLIPK